MNIEYIESEDKIFVTNENGKIEERKKLIPLKKNCLKKMNLKV